MLGSNNYNLYLIYLRLVLYKSVETDYKVFNVFPLKQITDFFIWNVIKTDEHLIKDLIALEWISLRERERHHWLRSRIDVGFYRWLRITAVSHWYADVSLVNTYVPVTCVLSAFSTQLAYNRIFARVRGESARRLRVSRPFTASSLVHSLSLSSLFPTLRLALSHVPSPPPSILSFSYSTYIIRTTRRQSVQRHRCRRLVRLTSSSSPSFLLSLSLPPVLPISILSLISFSFSSLVNHAVLLSPLSEPASVSKFYLNVLIRARLRSF